MSYGIIRIQKMSRGQIQGIQIHDQREKNYSHSNPDINFDKSHLNVDLHNEKRVEFHKLIKKRINSLNFKKAVRKDAILMCQCMVTSDKSFFDKMSKEETMQFFQDSYDFIKDRYGKENIISSIIHFDETTPHMHVNFVPVTNLGRLSARDLFKKSDFHKLHDDYYKFNNSKGYNLERGETREEKREHLTVEEFKISTGFEKIKRENANLEIEKEKIREKEKNIKIIEKDIEKKEKESNKKIDLLKSKISGINDSIKHFDIIDSIEQKNTITGRISINKADYKTLKDYAKMSEMHLSKISDLTNKNYKLEKKLESTENKVSKLEKQNYNLIDKNRIINKKFNDLAPAYNSILRFLKSENLMNDYMAKIEKQNELERQRDNSWEMER